MSIKALVKILILYCIISSCEQNSTVDYISKSKDLLLKVDEDDIVEKYKLYNIMPITWGYDRISFIFPDSTHLLLTDFIPGKPHLLRVTDNHHIIDNYLKKFQNQVSQDHLLKSYRILLDLYDHNIIGLENTNNTIKLYSNIKYNESCESLVFINTDSADSLNFWSKRDIQILDEIILKNWTVAITDRFCYELTR